MPVTLEKKIPNTLVLYLHDNDHPNDRQWPVSYSIVIIQIPPELEHAMFEDHEHHHTAREDEGVGPHTVLVHQYVGVDG